MSRDWLAAKLASTSSSRRTDGWFPEYRDDPVGFFRDVLGIKPWARQAEVLDAVANHTRVAVRSGHKVSKSNSAAGLALWWVCTRKSGRVIVTSSGARQVKHIIWRELRNLHRIAMRPLGGDMAVDPGTGFRFEDGRQVLGYTTNDAERMAGISGAELLFIVDEASGFPDEIYEAIVGNMAGGAKLVAFGNPTKTSGWYFDAFRTKGQLWHQIHVSSRESPNVTAGEIVVPGLATREWCEDVLSECNGDPTHAVYMVRVLGEFPEHASNAVIGLEAVQSAQERATSPVGALTVGVDVARFGDDESVIWAVRGTTAIGPVTLSGQDGYQVADAVINAVEQWRLPSEQQIPVRVDAIGVGASVVDALRRHPKRRLVHVQAVNVGEKSTDGDHYNLRSQLWFALGDWLQTGSIPRDQALAAELLAPTYTFDLRGRKKVESKDDIKRRLKRSPDRADALALAVYSPPTGTTPYRSVRKRATAGWGKHF